MARTTLDRIAKKALADPSFWKALRSDPETALRRAKLDDLAPASLRKLKRMLKRKRFAVVVRIDAQRLARHIPIAPGQQPWRSWIDGGIDWYNWGH